jgi:dUTP pyrophosphatase
MISTTQKQLPHWWLFLNILKLKTASNYIIRDCMFLVLIFLMTEIVIPFQKLSDKWKIPSQATFSDAGYDLFSTEEYILKPGERKLFKTNISAAIPHGYYGRIAPRSGLAYKHGIDVLAGVIDSGYRGDIGIILINFWQEDFPVHEGDKIAQFIIEKCHYVEWQEGDVLPESQRGEEWRGSTGK